MLNKITNKKVRLIFLYMSVIIFSLSYSSAYFYNIRVECDNDVCLEGADANFSISIYNEGLHWVEFSEIKIYDSVNNTYLTGIDILYRPHNSERGDVILVMGLQNKTVNLPFTIPEANVHKGLMYYPCFTNTITDSLIVAKYGERETTHCYPDNRTVRVIECLTDDECFDNEFCNVNTCFRLKCQSCQYIYGHKCLDYECCEPGECMFNQECRNNTCINLTCKEDEKIHKNQCVKLNCSFDEYPINHTCEKLDCDREQYPVDHTCKSLDCSYDEFVSDHECKKLNCRFDQGYENHECVDLNCRFDEEITNHSCVPLNCLFFQEIRNRTCENNQKVILKIILEIIVIITIIIFLFIDLKKLKEKKKESNKKINKEKGKLEKESDDLGKKGDEASFLDSPDEKEINQLPDVNKKLKTTQKKKKVENNET